MRSSAQHSKSEQQQQQQFNSAGAYYANCRAFCAFHETGTRRGDSIKYQLPFRIRLIQ